MHFVIQGKDTNKFHCHCEESCTQDDEAISVSSRNVKLETKKTLELKPFFIIPVLIVK
ncbi:hypothetical protein KKC56_00075 [Patescibacteria group bacterium]|nr:hypothetical protein [Patescibacteria group bacterium]